MSDIEKMVATSKQTTYLGSVAWTVPNGKCTTNFSICLYVLGTVFEGK